MSCEVAALPIQAKANYGTWSIDFVCNTKKRNHNYFLLKNKGTTW